ncbi:hypothetical protein CPB86DRAFT_800985, partial [Serendipita vermifera]
IIDKFDEMMDKLASTEKNNATPREVSHRLDQVFFSCCQKHPGSVVVRQSYSAYQKLSLSDLEDLREQGYDTDWDPTESYDTLSDSSIESEFENSPQLLEKTLGAEELHQPPNQFGSASGPLQDPVRLIPPSSGTALPLPLRIGFHSRDQEEWTHRIYPGFNSEKHHEEDDSQQTKKGSTLFPYISSFSPITSRSELPSNRLEAFMSDEEMMDGEYEREDAVKMEDEDVEVEITEVEMKDGGNTSASIIHSTVFPNLFLEGHSLHPHRKDVRVPSSIHPQTSHEGQKKGRHGDPKPLPFLPLVQGTLAPLSGDLIPIPMPSLDTFPQPLGRLHGLVDNPPLTGWSGQLIEEPVMNALTSQVPEQHRYGNDDTTYTYISPPLLQSRRAEAAITRVHQHDTFDSYPPSSSTLTSLPQYQSYGLTPSLQQTSYHAPVGVSVLSTHPPTPSTDSNYDPGLFPWASQVHTNAGNLHVVPEPVKGNGTIRSLQELTERNPHEDSMKNGGASLFLEFYHARKNKWEKWKTELPQEPRDQRRSTRAQSSSKNDSRNSICERIDFGIETIDLAEGTLNTLDSVLLKIREETTCKKGEELLRSLVKFYAGNTEESLSVVIERIFIKLEEGTKFLTHDESTNSNLQSSSSPSTSRSNHGSTSTSAAIFPPPDLQQSGRKSLIFQRVSPTDLAGSAGYRIKRKEFRLGVHEDGDSRPVQEDNAWDTSQNVLLKLASYLLQGSPSYNCFACGSYQKFSNGENLAHHMKDVHWIRRGSTRGSENMSK